MLNGASIDETKVKGKGVVQLIDTSGLELCVGIHNADFRIRYSKEKEKKKKDAIDFLQKLTSVRALGCFVIEVKIRSTEWVNVAQQR